MQLDTAIDHFLRAKRRENRSEHTLIAYDKALYQFASLAPDIKESEDIDAWSLNTYIDALIEYQNSGRYKDVTVANRVRHVKAFVNWCVANELVRSNPFAGGKNAKVKVPAFEKKDVETISREDFQRLLADCEADSPAGRRDAVIVRFLLDTGVRVDEMTSLKTDDVDLKNGMAKVVGKGRKWRTVFFGTETAVAISKYMKRRHLGNPYFIAGWRDKRMTNSGVLQMLKRRGLNAGCEQSIHPHLFRHTFATEALRNGMSPAEVQRILGHEDISTTIRNYVHLVTEDIQKAHQRYSPMTNFMKRSAARR